MGNVDPATLRDVIIIIGFFIITVCAVINTFNKSKIKPPHGETLASIGVRLQSLYHDLEETKNRHTKFEEKMTTQLGDIWKQYDKLLTAVAENGGILKSFIHEMRNWRTSHDAKDNHS